VWPCGPSQKIEEKIKFKLISYHTVAENIKSLEITHGNRLSRFLPVLTFYEIYRLPTLLSATKEGFKAL
jgi:hypothetical protein